MGPSGRHRYQPGAGRASRGSGVGVECTPQVGGVLEHVDEMGPFTVKGGGGQEKVDPPAWGSFTRK